MKLVRCEHYNACTNELSEIRSVVRCACKKMGFSESEINLLPLAIDEACNNIIPYAYCVDKSGRIELEVDQSEDEAIFFLTDYAFLFLNLLKVVETLQDFPGVSYSILSHERVPDVFFFTILYERSCIPI